MAATIAVSALNLLPIHILTKGHMTVGSGKAAYVAIRTFTKGRRTVGSGNAATFDQNPSATTQNNVTVQNPYQLLLDRSKENDPIIDIRVAVIGNVW
jgi:hypothetical protein